MKHCFRVGLYKQGLLHDLSKYCPVEFIPGVKYFQGDKSPNNVQREIEGCSTAWLHHKGRNKHHYEYWIDNFDGRSKPTYHKIPYKYLMEMMADWFAAGRTYVGSDFTVQDEINWWKWKRETIAIHPATIEWIDQFMKDIKKV